MTTADDLEPMLTVDDVCDLLRVNKDWVYDHIQQKKIPHYRIGGRHLRFKRSEVIAYIKARHIEAIE